MPQAINMNTIRPFTIADLNTEKDNEPRIIDTALASRLGYARHYKIRELIVRNETELCTYGSLPLRRGQSRGQPFTEYFLNEPQSLLLCMFAKTAKAAKVRKMLIDVFMEYRQDRIEKPIAVKSHNRRTSTKLDDALRLRTNIDRLEAITDRIQPAQPNMCAMVIDGQPVWVDVNKYDGAGRAVTIEHDGSIRVQYVEPSISDYNPMGPRTATGEPYPSGYGGTCRNRVAVIGMVIEQGLQPTPPMQIEHEPVKRMVVKKGHPNQNAPFRDKILALLGTGLTKRQIAERVGCSYHGVDYWHRKMSAG